MASGNSTGARVRFERVGHSYGQSDHSLNVLDDISFEVAPGETLAIVGPSGSGKSTLLKLLMGRMTPSRGQVEVTSTRGEAAKRAVVFQEPTLLPWLSAADNVRLPLELEGRLDGADERVRNALTRTGLGDFAAFRPTQLSGGMQSRVALARGLVSDPDILLLDEPFSDLDEATSEDMMIDLASLFEQARVTAVMVTHSLVQAAYLADNVIVLSARPGRISTTHKIDGPRPRTRAYLDDQRLHTAVQTLRRSLRDAIHASAR